MITKHRILKNENNSFFAINCTADTKTLKLFCGYLYIRRLPAQGLLNVSDEFGEFVTVIIPEALQGTVPSNQFNFTLRLKK